jgi:thiol:disulfide interchange protein DsbD
LILASWWLITGLGHAAPREVAPPALPSLPASAQAQAVVEDGRPQLRARLIRSSDPTPRIGVLFDLAEGWHLYWRNPGGTGLAPRIDFEVEGQRVGDLIWPAPEVFDEADGLFTTYGYRDRVLLSAPLDAVEPGLGERRNAGDAVADVSVLVCRTQCVPASFRLTAPSETVFSDADRRSIDALFRDAAERAPVAATKLGLDAEANWVAGAPAGDETSPLEIRVRSCPREDAACVALRPVAPESVFIPMEDDTFEFSQASVVPARETPGAFTVRLAATRLGSGEDRLRGLLVVRESKGATRHVELDLPIGAQAAAVAPAGAAAPVGAGRWAQIFLIALLGGLILNGMPCVLPVLAIKVVAVANMASKHPREVRLEGLAYTAGVLGSMGLLAAIVISLRAAGHSVGWGFQFQEPLFVAGICALLVTFALNLFGVFEIELGQGRLAAIGHEAAGLRRSVFEGLLAVVLATPCTAPFLGTAVGFAFASSGFGIAAIFLAIGLGLAAPFLAVSFFPPLSRFIPRSGPWMMKLRAGLGFSLLATVVWLLWVLGQSGGTDVVVGMIGVLLVLSFLLWGFGQLQPLHNVWLGRASAVAILCLGIAGFNWIDFDRADGATPPADAEAAESGWQTYSEAAVAEALSAGQPAFVVFTADWCITCQVNEHTVLDRETVRDALSEGGFALFKADWTRRDETIRQKLAEFGRAGVPLYLVYSPAAPDDPQVLSELLSQREVVSALSDSTNRGRS